MPEQQTTATEERFDEQLTFRIPRALRERIDRIARQDDRSAAYIARLAVERGLDQLEQERGIK